MYKAKNVVTFVEVKKHKMSSKNRTNKFIDTIDECLTNGVKNGIFQVSVEDQVLNGREVTIN
jgi:hypothetical protein